MISNNYINYLQESESIIESLNNVTKIFNDVQFLREVKELTTDKNANQIISKSKAFIKKTEHTLAVKYNADIKYIKLQANKAAKIIKSKSKDKNAKPEDVVKQLKSSILDPLAANITKGIKDSIKKSKEKSKEEDDKPETSDAVIKSVLLLYGVIFVQAALNILLTATIGQKASAIITAVVVAPISEEYSKSLALKQKYPMLYTTIFNIFEGGMYVIQLAMMGLSIPKIIILRLLAVLMHYTTTVTQIILTKKLGEDSLVPFYVAVCMHAVYNLIMILGNTKMTGWAGKK